MLYEFDSNILLKEQLKIIKYLDIAIKIFNENAYGEYKKCIHFLPIIPFKLDIMKKQKWWYAAVSFSGTKNNITQFYFEIDKETLTYDGIKLYFIVAHELAHCIDFMMRGDSFHDKKWKKICNIIGAQPSSAIDIKDLRKVRKKFKKQYNLIKKYI